MAVEGVEVACLNRFKRVGAYPDRQDAASSRSPTTNSPSAPTTVRHAEDGTFRIIVNAGEVGMTLARPRRPPRQAARPDPLEPRGPHALPVCRRQCRGLARGAAHRPARPYPRGIDPEEREPEKWRDLFTPSRSETGPPPAASRATPRPSPGRRWCRRQPANTGDRRAPATPAFVAQYDLTLAATMRWEIMRAFARAAHVLLGHLTPMPTRAICARRRNGTTSASSPRWSTTSRRRRLPPTATVALVIDPRGPASSRSPAASP